MDASEVKIREDELIARIKERNPKVDEDEIRIFRMFLDSALMDCGRCGFRLYCAQNYCQCLLGHVEAGKTIEDVMSLGVRMLQDTDILDKIWNKLTREEKIGIAAGCMQGIVKNEQTFDKFFVTFTESGFIKQFMDELGINGKAIAQSYVDIKNECRKRREKGLFWVCHT